MPLSSGVYPLAWSQTLPRERVVPRVLSTQFRGFGGIHHSVHPHCLIPGHFSSPNRSPSLPLPQPWTTTNPLPVPMDVSVLDIPHKRTHTLCGLLCLASLTKRRVFKVHRVYILRLRDIPLFRGTTLCLLALHGRTPRLFPYYGFVS